MDKDGNNLTLFKYSICYCSRETMYKLYARYTYLNTASVIVQEVDNITDMEDMQI